MSEAGSEPDLPFHTDLLQEPLVVAHHDQGPVEAGQRAFQLLDGCQVELIGRLVQEQQQRRLGLCEHARQSRPQALAAQLGMHVQSVRYRLGRLRELFGDDLDDPAARFELQIALRASSHTG